jgi:hypothetical protein
MLFGKRAGRPRAGVKDLRSITDPAAGSKDRLHEGPEAAHADPALSARASPVSADDAGGFAIRLIRSRGSPMRGDVPAAPSTSGTLRRVFGDDSPQKFLCEGVYRPIGGALRCG